MTGKIAIIGAGLIGQSWAICFARAGYRVALYDAQPGAAVAAQQAIAASCAALAQQGLLHGRAVAEVCGLITSAASLKDAVSDAVYVQENTPENPQIKREVFADLDAAAAPDAVIASSTSALVPSQFAAGLPGAHRCLVAHPLNPPHLIPAVELVPGDATSDAAMVRASDVMQAIGQSPIRTSREIEGFIMNRLQGAVLDEAFGLVEQGIASPQDIDIAMRDGLARRWVFMGPFETIDLNAPGGVADFMDRYGPAYERIGSQRPDRPSWTGRLRAQLIAASQGRDRQGRASWRDACLARLVGLIEDTRRTSEHEQPDHR